METFEMELRPLCHTQTHRSGWFLSGDALLWFNAWKAAGLEHYTRAPDPVFLPTYPAGRFSTCDARGTGIDDFALSLILLLPGTQRPTFGKTWLRCFDSRARDRRLLHDWRFYRAL